MRAVLVLLSVLTLSACMTPNIVVVAPPRPVEDVPVSVTRALEVSRRMEPVAEAVCRSQAPRLNCDFEMLVNRDPRAGVNAFQTINPEDGRPIIILTVGLIRAVRNADELAFVIGHEAAHHIANHIGQQEEAALAGARIFGANAQQQGANRAGIIEAAQNGALLGSRQFSQRAELEADSLGTLIACRAGFDASLGSQFFSQLPDPGAQILGTHPPNAARVNAVRVAAGQYC